MEQKPTIYTYGNTTIEANELIHLLQPHYINCVLDCRPTAYTCMGKNTPMSMLQTALRQHDIAYIPFFKHFGLFPPETRDKQGSILYTKATSTPNFLQGMEFIENSIEKGYHICIINEEPDIHKSKRFTLIAKRLKERYDIIHLFENGHYLSQEQVEQQKEEKAQQRQQLNQARQAIGSNGEEIAALYLSKNGYQILDRNWNLYRGCELDIIARKDNTLHFIEVKTRTSDLYGAPESAINRKKMLHLYKAIHSYRYRRNLHQTNFQIDSIAILYRNNNDYDLKHFLDIRLNGGACTDVVSYIQRP